MKALRKLMYSSPCSTSHPSLSCVTNTSRSSVPASRKPLVRNTVRLMVFWGCCAYAINAYRGVSAVRLGRDENGWIVMVWLGGARCKSVVKIHCIHCIGFVLYGCMGTCFWSDELACQLRIESGVDELLRHHVDGEGAKRYVHLHANFNHRYDQEAACLLEIVSRKSATVLFGL